MSAWKNFERDICRMFGGERRGADYVDRSGKGKNDCKCKGWSIEIKFRRRIPHKVIVQDALKARERAKPGEIPIAITKVVGSGSREDNTLVSMTLKDFIEWFGGNNV